MSLNGVGEKTYNEFVQELQQKGYKTTSLGANETNFEEYGNALSGSLKKELTDSFDCEQDYELQSQIASLYNSNKSVITSGNFVSALKNMGLNVNVAYQETNYISDYKAGNFSGAESVGAIAIYTISDGNGGEIKIADANGNGALEVEEIFMNQILGDITHEITSSSGSNNSSAIQETSNVFESQTNIKEEEKEEENTISQYEFNKVVEEKLKDGTSIFLATSLAQIELDVDNMKYTGNYEEEKQDENLDQEKIA